MHLFHIVLLLIVAMLLFVQPASAASPVLVEPDTPQPAEEAASTTYLVEPGDTLSGISERFAVPVEELARVNNLADMSVIHVGQQLLIPGGDGSLPEVAVDFAAPSTVEERAGVVERLTANSRRASISSPFHRTTWVTYYGRPEVPIMGILGEYSIDELTPRLREQAAAYDDANGPGMGVQPVFHLVYGMATKAPGEDGSHLAYLPDDVTLAYIERAQQEGFTVILDIQVGAWEPLQAMEVAFPYLKYENVHLALDPEFAMATPGQEIPGQPPGFVTAAQVNDVQRAMRDYLKAEGIPGRKVLLLHQFLDSMIVDKEALEQVRRVDLTITADGFGGPWPKVSKYNSFISPETEFAGFKLFYRWDEPLLTERQVLGIDQYPGITLMEVTPNLIIYQ